MKHYYNVKSYARTPEIQELPSLIDIQLKSFEDFLYRGRLLELFDEINPIESFNRNLLLYFPGNIPEAREFGLKFWFEEPKYDEDACLERDMSYASPLHVRVALMNRAEGDEVITQDIFLGDFPLMTEKGTFIINGTERVVVSQLIRSPGVYFDVEEERATGRSLSNAKMIPDRGAWMEFETRKTDYITIKFNRKRTIPVTVLLRALAAVDDGLPPEMSPVKTGNDDEMRRLFADLDTDEAHPYIESSLKNEPEWDVKKKQTIAEVALIEFYRRMRPGDPPTLDNARNYLEGQLFDQRRYDLERVGRHKLNQRRRDLVKKLEELGREGAIEVLGLKDEIDPEHRTMTKADIVALVAQMILINNGQGERNDIDHLGNRRVKTVGELIGNKLRIGLRRMERVVRERMSIREAEQLTPVALVNIRPIVAAVREFFGSSQLSQFMEQTNPLSELTHKRTLSALGPGGLRRERAGFDVRDVHHSHYGRICPIETPEGPNIGLIGRLASYARVNELGFIETPYRKVVNELPVDDPDLIGRTVRDDIEAVIVEERTVIDAEIVKELRKHGIKEVSVVEGLSIPTSEVEYNFEKVSNKDLLGQVVAEDIEAAVVVAGTVIDATVVRKLKKQGIKEVSVVEGLSIPTSVKDFKSIEVFTRDWVESDTNEYNLEKVSNKDLLGQVVAEDIEDDKGNVIVKASAKINAKVLEKLVEQDIEKVKTVSYVGNEDLIEHRVFDTIKGNKGNVIVKASTKIDAKVVKKLKKQGIKEVKVVSYTAKKVDDPDLIGYKTADDIEAVVVKEGTVIDATAVRKLKKQGIREVKVETYVGNKDLIGRSVYNTIKDDKGNVIVKASAKINARILKKLVEQGIEKVKVETYTAKKVDDPDLIGYKAADDIEAVIVEEDTIIDAKVVRKLKKHGREKVLVVSIPTSVKEVKSMEVFTPNWKDLLRQVVAKDIEAVIVVAGTVIDATAMRKLKKQGIKEVPVVEGLSIPTSVKEVKSIEVFTSNWVESDTKEVEYNLEKVSDKDLFGQVVAEDIEDDKGNVIVKASTKINAKVLEKLVEQDIEKVKTVSYVGNKALIGRSVFDTIKGNKGNVIVKASTKIDAKVVKKLKKQGIKEVPVVSYTAKKVDDLDLIGCKAADDIEAVIVKEGTDIDATAVKKLRKHGIKEVPVETSVGNKDLLRQVVAEDIKDDKGNVIVKASAKINARILKKLVEQGIKEVPVETYTDKEVPVVPFATYDIEYLSADTEDRYRIAQANSHLDERNQFVSRRVSARHDQKFLTVPRDRLEYMDIAPRQIVGISAALIPFLSHDDANRALMGSNMQRQAVPLLTPDVSVVSTGMESQAASDSGQVLVSDIEAEVVSVQGHRVIVKTKEGEELVYPLRKYDRSNQSTCIDQRPLVRKGDTIKPGDVIADSSSTYEGRLALGHDVLTCFLSWDGGNYEDALLVSEDMLRNDKFTSIHIEKHEIEARDTKLGPEEITYDIPNVGEEALKDLDERGIVRIGAEVGPNDILVGKITPKGEKELSPEEKLLRAIFGEQAREVKDSSLRLPHGDRGKVVDVKIFTRDEYPDLPAGVEKMVRVSVAQRRKLTVGDKMSGRHGNKGVISKIVPIEDMPYIEGGVPVEIILNPLGVPGRMNIGQILELHLGWAADRLGFRAVTPVFDGAREDEIRADLGRAWMIDWAWKYITERAWENAEHLAEMGQMKLEEFDDDMHVICAYLVHRVGESGEYDNEAIILERDEIYVRRVAVAEVLREFGYAPDEVMVYNNEGLSNEERDRRDQNALRVSLCLWIGQNAEQEVELGDDLEIRDLFKIADQVMFETGSPVPHYGKQRLYDGRTGEPFDRDVAVGYVHMLKLAHLVEDKAHARSTGPYSLVTQQPLGGKAQFGGQRFGEMEVWALEAYGAAYILQEMLTVKSDDVQGRVKTYESIVKGEDIEEPGIPTSFRVLVKELQSLGLAVEAITSSGDVIRFGKDDEQARRPQPATGLLRLGSN